MEIVQVDRSGFARRRGAFPASLRVCEDFAGASLTTTQLMTLVLRMGRVVYQVETAHGEIVEAELTPGAKSLLAYLVTYTSNLKWRGGEPFVWVGNATMAEENGVSVRTVQNWLAELEAAGFLVRRYDRRNGRVECAGIDLRPLGARAKEIADSVAERAAGRAAGRTHARQERREEYSRGDEISVTQEYKPKGSHSDSLRTPHRGNVENPEPNEKAECASSAHRSMDSGRHGARYEGAPRPGSAEAECASSVPLEQLAEKRILALMIEGSATFRAKLAEKTHPFPMETASVNEIAAALGEIRLGPVFASYSPSQWQSALRRHGARACLALLLAADRDGVRDRVGYLAGILRKSATDPTFDPEEGLRRMRRH